MNHKFKFDHNSYKWQVNDYEYNCMFARELIRYLMDEFENRGYLYLNQIYEMFGIKWNPDNENSVIRYYEYYRNVETPLFCFNEDENKNCVHIMIDAYYEGDS